MVEERNPILDRDSYKTGHHLQLSKNYQWFSSYMEAREGAEQPYTFMLGLGALVQDLYSRVPTMEEISEAAKVVHQANGAHYLNTEVWERVNKLGYYPMRIVGLPEGTLAPIGTPLFKLEPTQDWFASTCNGEETKLMRSWYPMALATRLMILRGELYPLFKKTGSLDTLDVAVNGFECRSGRSGEDSDWAGMIHQFVFRGSDNLHGQLKLNRRYRGGEERMLTVWATEHACALSYGPGEGEFEYLKAQLRTHKNMIKSVVDDTYDQRHFLDDVVRRKDVKDLILAHEGRVVFRNDSRNMIDEILYGLESLEKTFGSRTVNGYKVLNQNVGMMQADGVKPHTTVNLYEVIMDHGWACSNLVVGGGTGLMFDGLSRDTNRNAIKPSVNKIDGKLIDVSKKAHNKESKGGVLLVDSNFKTHSSLDFAKGVDDPAFMEISDIMVPYYVNGNITVDNFQSIYNRMHNI